MKEALLSAKEIVKTYPDRQEPILNRISIEIYQGDFTSMMGPSGAGSSPRLDALGGRERGSGTGNPFGKKDGLIAGQGIWLCVSTDIFGE